MHRRSAATVTAMMGDGGFMPHAYCFLWNPGLMLLHAVSDSLIALAYFSIPALLLYFVRKRADMPLRPIATFAVFIVACGLTHAFSVWTLWHADYWLSGAVKALTAAASLATAFSLVPLIPKVLKFRSASGLERQNFELETRYQRLMETAQEGIWTVDPAGCITFVNRKLAQMLGYEENELIGRSAFDFVLASERDESRERFLHDRLVNSAQQDRCFENKSGAPVFTICSSNPIYDKAGTCTGVLAMYADVTERRRAENELLRSEDRNRSVAEALPQMVWASTGTGDMFYYSARWFEYTGAPVAQLLGWGWQPFLHPDDLADCLERWNHARSNGIPFEAENRLRRSDGTYRWHLSRALPIRDESGEIVQWFGAATDIDDQKMALEAQQRLTEQLAYIVEATDRLANSLESQESLQTLCELIVPRFADWIAVNMVEADG
ncbi:MAG: PAS domain-containing protein, partial [Candidatus Eremiobacteraeota bacterium]|nr:PAS domain-containing protein [Candidatus Eremiobacteraeota bacterium]